MDIYTTSKSRWRPNSKSRHGGSRKCPRSCTVCHPTRLAANKHFIARDLDAEYTKPASPIGRPATEYVEWFFGREDEEDEEVERGDEGEGWGDWSGEEVGMLMGMGREEYERMVREHVEVERQLERERERVNMRGSTKREVIVEGEGHVDRDWDVVSVGSVDSIRVEDWEEVIVE